MNKTEAAEFLGVSVRSLERYTKQSRVAARYEKGKTNNVLLYDRAELERFKAELESVTHLPTVERPAVEASNRMETPPTANLANTDTALARFGGVSEGNANPAALALLGALVQHLGGAPEVAASVAASGGAPHTPPAQKLLLSLAEAQSYSGLSRANLMEAIHDESLPAQKIGRGWKIKRRDLENYVDGL